MTFSVEMLERAASFVMALLEELDRSVPTSAPKTSP